MRVRTTCGLSVAVGLGLFFRALASNTAQLERAYVSNDGASIHTVQVDGTGDHAVWTAPAKVAISPRVSPSACRNSSAPLCLKWVPTPKQLHSRPRLTWSGGFGSSYSDRGTGALSELSAMSRPAIVAEPGDFSE
jgi:hypothetical protein